jgi:two-component system sporulation sensor kinase A
MREVTERVLEQERLREAEELYDLISQNAQDIITISSPTGVVQYVSPAVEKLLGYKTEEIVGKEYMEFYHPDDFLLLKERSYDDEDVFWCRLQHKDGHYVWFETAFKIIRNGEGAVEGILGVGRDISSASRRSKR